MLCAVVSKTLCPTPHHLSLPHVYMCIYNNTSEAFCPRVIRGLCCWSCPLQTFQDKFTPFRCFVHSPCFKIMCGHHLRVATTLYFKVIIFSMVYYTVYECGNYLTCRYNWGSVVIRICGRSRRAWPTGRHIGANRPENSQGSPGFGASVLCPARKWNLPRLFREFHESLGKHWLSSLLNFIKSRKMSLSSCKLD